MTYTTRRKKKEIKLLNNNVSGNTNLFYHSSVVVSWKATFWIYPPKVVPLAFIISEISAKTSFYPFYGSDVGHKITWFTRL